MTDTVREAYHTQLLALDDRVRGDLAAVQDEALRSTGGEAGGGLSNAPVHPADLGTGLFKQEVATALMENEGHLLRQIAGALDRLAQGTFGRCQECGRDVAAERLRVLPYTPHCVRCAGRLQREAGGPEGF